MNILKHVNINLSHPCKAAELCLNAFDWKIRCDRSSAIGGHSIHTGTEDDYTAEYETVSFCKCLCR